MTEYQLEQMDALELVTEYLSGLAAAAMDALKGKLTDYLCFRRYVDDFLSMFRFLLDLL